MNRRVFAKIIGTIAVSPALFSTSAFAKNETMMKHSIKPERLQKGDLIRLIAPGSPCSEEKINTAITKLEDQGFAVKYTETIRKRFGYLAGTDQERIDDIHAAFLDKEAKAIWCIRGGYGCTRILPMLDYKLIKENPKIVIGYSDITALIHAIHQKTGLIGFHGPVGATPPSDYNQGNLERILMHPVHPVSIGMSEQNLLHIDEAYRPFVINSGIAEGELSGGNLCLLAAMAGTHFQVDFKDKLVFLEEVGEKPYRIDRMITQLLQSSNLQLAKGIVLGIFEDCQPKNEDFSLNLKDTLLHLFKPLGIPVLYGFSFGHIQNMCTFPIGIKARLNTDKMEVTLLETAVR